MFIGHYGVSLIAKRAAPRVSLGVLFLAAQAVDILFMSLVLLGVERLRLTPGFTAFNDLELVFMPYSHSLVAAVVWGLVCGVAAYALLKSRGAAIAIGLAVGTHYFVDLPFHVPDLPLAGGDSPKLGLGLWNYFGLSLAMEWLALALGAFFYLRPLGHPKNVPLRAWAFFAGLAAIATLTPFVPPPPSSSAFALQALVAFFALAAWARWVDRAVSPAPAAAAAAR